MFHQSHQIRTITIETQTTSHIFESKPLCTLVNLRKMHQNLFFGCLQELVLMFSTYQSIVVFQVDNGRLQILSHCRFEKDGFWTILLEQHVSAENNLVSQRGLFFWTSKLDGQHVQRKGHRLNHNLSLEGV